MDALAAYGSDDSSSSDSDAPAPVAAPVPAPANNNPTTTRKRRWDNGSTTKPDNNGLPAPRLSKFNDDGAMVEWDVNYLATHGNGTSLPLSEESRRFLTEQLLKATTNNNGDSGGDDAKREDNKIGWAAQLKVQHDFHNPRYMDNLMSRQMCGISQVLGSNAANQETFEDYEYRLLELEEQARIQEGQVQAHPAEG